MVKNRVISVTVVPVFSESIVNGILIAMGLKYTNVYISRMDGTTNAYIKITDKNRRNLCLALQDYTSKTSAMDK